jgi:hypothetical protein
MGTMTICGRLIAFLVGLTLPSSVGAAEEWPPPSYSAKQIRATLVDEDSGQPIEGVVVVAQWVLWVAGPGGHGPRLHVLETVTDSTGQFYFPAWGPKPNPRYPITRLMDRDPLLSFFKPGYRPRSIQNRWDRNDSVRFSEWDGKPIGLKRFGGTDSEWAKELRNLQTSLDWLDDFDWRLTPRMVLALESERLALKRKRVYVPGFTPISLEELGTTVEEVRRFMEAQK